MFRCGPTLLCGPASFFIRANVMNSIDPFGGGRGGSASRAGPLDNGGSLFIYRGVRQQTRAIVFHSSKCLLIPQTAEPVP
jgi:hypothetical protein